MGTYLGEPREANAPSITTTLPPFGQFLAEVASRKAKPRSCQARGQVAMKRCSRSFSCEPSL